MNSAILALQEEYSRRQASIESLPAKVYNRNQAYYQQSLKDLDAEIDVLIAEQEYLRNMPLWVLDTQTPEQAEEIKALGILVSYVPPEPETIAEAESAILIGDPTWEFPWTDAEVASEEMNHRPEVGF